MSRAMLAVASATLLASCSSTGDPIERLGLTPQQISAATLPSAKPSGEEIATTEAGYFIIGEDDPVLPDAVDLIPTTREGKQLAPRLARVTAPRESEPAAALSQAEIETVVQTRIGPAGPVVETVAAAPASLEPAPQPKKRGFLASLFSTDEPEATPAPKPKPRIVAASVAEQPAPKHEEEAHATAAAEPARPEKAEPKTAAVATFVENRSPDNAAAAVADQKKRNGFLSAFFSPAQAAPAPQIQPNKPLTLASVAPAPAQPRPLIGNDALPGVRQGDLFEITRKSGMDDVSDIDLHEEDEVQVAMAPGLARLAPNGLLQQTDRVDVGCLKPSLIRMLKTIEGHYGKKVVVTSGYRSPPVNRRARGAPNSLHMYCAAADIQVPGVTKWELAQYLRTMPGRGGVGTYCHTESVHVDVGPERDWNWRCRKRRG